MAKRKTKKQKRNDILVILLCVAVIAALAIFALNEKGLITIRLPAKPSDTVTVEAGESSVHFINVGQGDSELIVATDGTTMLIDSGEAEYGPVVLSYLEELGIDRFTSYNLYQEFREINSELTGAEASTAKRNAINNLDLTDQEKLEVFATFMLDQASENYGENRQKYQTMLDEGLTWDEVTQANNLYAMLNEDEEMTATEKATEFAKWADQQEWTEGQKTALEEKFKFWES